MRRFEKPKPSLQVLFASGGLLLFLIFLRCLPPAVMRFASRLRQPSSCRCRSLAALLSYGMGHFSYFAGNGIGILLPLG